MPVTNANTEEEKDEQFTKALSAALRSDPDVILVGETRSLSTASLAFKGALSGHGVWTTLHANSAPAIITRLRDMGIQSYMLNDPELVKGLVS
jgi:type II secretory ATPase GspE/PulE/Tfp pilus assembly ATPase PilB-like protein